ncbi:hypothetical protein B4N89_14165 [Embleya scabrispora]|uniref:Uncharacterized protein n=1 Tax=Embleya scabrispora TaxID=159449 RepID=A0A1T3NZ27_9ACTN|nr:hypothetical protein B4N89_14165 [Embleya scabrispora]
MALQDQAARVPRADARLGWGPRRACGVAAGPGAAPSPTGRSASVGSAASESLPSRRSAGTPAGARTEGRGGPKPGGDACGPPPPGSVRPPDHAPAPPINAKANTHPQLSATAAFARNPCTPGLLGLPSARRRRHPCL